MIPYFRAGLEGGEACLWLVSRKNGIDFSCVTAEGLIPGFLDYASSGQFEILSAEDWYLTDGSFDEDRAIANISSHLTKIRAKNFDRLRAAGDIGGAVPRADWARVEAYEKKISSWLKANSVIALCSYPILECAPSQVKGILDSHEDVLIGRL